MGPYSGRLFFVPDRITGTHLRVDGGADRSFVLATAGDRQRGKSTTALQAVNKCDCVLQTMVSDSRRQARGPICDRHRQLYLTAGGIRQPFQPERDY